MTLDILKYPHPTLCKRAKEIERVTPDIRDLAAEMAETMYASQGVGLAATQVGECLRLITVDITGPEKREGLLTLVNPRIVSAAGEHESEEGCLSVKDYRSNVVRSETVKVEATDLDGNPVCLEAEGLLAVCLQHEIDHLDGKLFIDHISRLKRAFYDKRVRKWAREKAQKDS